MDFTSSVIVAILGIEALMAALLISWVYRAWSRV